MAGVEALDFDSPDKTWTPARTRVDVVRTGGSATAAIACEARCPRRWFVGWPGTAPMHTTRRAVGAAGEDSASPGVDLYQVLGMQRRPLVADHDGAGAGERDIQLRVAGDGLVVGLNRVEGGNDASVLVGDGTSAATLYERLSPYEAGP